MASRPHVNMRQLAARAEVPERAAQQLFDVMAACWEEGVEVRVPGLGVFRSTIVPGRDMKSPIVSGGSTVHVPARRRVTFRPTGALKAKWVLG